MDTSRLFSPLPVGPATLRNRIVFCPMFVGYAHPDGTVSDRMIGHYARRARGGAALVITEYASVHPSGAESPRQLRIWDDSCRKGLVELSRAIRREGALASLQLVHGGRYAWNQERIAPSPVPFEPFPGTTLLPRALTIEEIGEIIRSFGSAARTARECGFDGVEIHGGSGYLHTQFISPRTNRRTDNYGGTPENRMRFALETVRAIRKEAGKDLILGYHFMVDEWMPGGFTAEMAPEFAKRLEEEGVSYLIAVGGMYDSWREDWVRKRTQHSPYQEDLAALLKPAVRIPVMANGRIDHPRMAEALLESGAADAVALARPLFADPDFPAKAASGREKEIVRCIPYCTECLEGYKRELGATCYVWPEAVRRDGFWGIPPSGS